MPSPIAEGNEAPDDALAQLGQVVEERHLAVLVGPAASGVALASARSINQSG